MLDELQNAIDNLHQKYGLNTEVTIKMRPETGPSTIFSSEDLDPS